MHEFCINLRQLYGDSRKFLLLGESWDGRAPELRAGTLIGKGVPAIKAQVILARGLFPVPGRSSSSGEQQRAPQKLD